MEIADDKEILKAVVFDRENAAGFDESFWKINGLLSKCSSARNMDAVSILLTVIWALSSSLAVFGSLIYEGICWGKRKGSIGVIARQYVSFPQEQSGMKVRKEKERLVFLTKYHHSFDEEWMCVSFLTISYKSQYKGFPFQFPSISYQYSPNPSNQVLTGLAVIVYLVKPEGLSLTGWPSQSLFNLIPWIISWVHILY